MRPISGAAGEELLWVQPAPSRPEHELRAGEDVVATLRFQRGSLADAEAEGKDQPLILFKGRHGLVKAKGAVEIQPGARGAPDVPLLVPLGWYLILLHADDAAAASALVAATAST